MASKWLVALKQPEQAHTGFEVALERQHCQFELAVALRKLQSSHFERTVAAKWLKWLLCVASKWLESNHFEHVVASEGLQSRQFERTVVSKWLKWLPCVK